MTIKREVYATNDEWLEARRGTIGASEAYMALGLAPWKSQREWMAEKAGLKDPGPPTPNMVRGNELQAWLLRRATEELPKGDRSIRACRLERLTNSECRHLHASPDGIILRGNLGTGAVERVALVELKTVSRWAFDKSWTEHEPADYVALQCQQQMAVTGIHTCHVVAQHMDEWRRYYYRLEFDAELWAPISEELLAVWEQLQRVIQEGPDALPPDPREEDAVPGKVWQATPRLLDDALSIALFEETHYLPSEFSAAKRERDRAEERVLRAMGDAEIAEFGETKVLRKVKRRTKYGLEVVDG